MNKNLCWLAFQLFSTDLVGVGLCLARLYRSHNRHTALGVVWMLDHNTNNSTAQREGVVYLLGEGDCGRWQHHTGSEAGYRSTDCNPQMNEHRLVQSGHHPPKAASFIWDWEQLNHPAVLHSWLTLAPEMENFKGEQCTWMSGKFLQWSWVWLPNLALLREVECAAQHQNQKALDLTWMSHSVRSCLCWPEALEPCLNCVWGPCPGAVRPMFLRTVQWIDVSRTSAITAGTWSSSPAWRWEMAWQVGKECLSGWKRIAVSVVNPEW